jgi:hypothetical protein
MLNYGFDSEAQQQSVNLLSLFLVIVAARLQDG